MVRWPSLLCRRHAPYMVLKSTLESRVCRWTNSPADRLIYRQNVSRLSTCIDVLGRTFHCDRRNKTRWRTLSTLMFRLCARRCEYFVYIAVTGTDSSSVSELLIGTPQGSVLGPRSFVSYTEDVIVLGRRSCVGGNIDSVWLRLRLRSL